VRVRSAIIFITFILSFACRAYAQSPNGTISGMVVDATGAAIAEADIVVLNDATGVKYFGKTNLDGIYAVPNLPPGSYRIQVSKFGFKSLIKPDVTLNVRDALSINFTLPIGTVSDVVTVEGGAPLVNTQSASVSTVIDRNFVATLPLNGRSFNSLLQLTPGVVLAPSSATNPGQFSVAGQRSSANNFTVDGVSANFGIGSVLDLGGSGGGSAQAFSALGGTSSLVSVDALQEFHVETSSFAPEFGRSTGGQVMLATRSGTNDLHGGAFDYFRNDVLDANDWFANAAGAKRAPERHNDFGAYVGGPIAKDSAFFFASYEGARLRQPATSVIEVPSAASRTAASSAIAEFLNTFPVANGAASPDGSTALFTGSFSSPSTLNAGSIRIDKNFAERFSIFGRYNEAPSLTANRNNSPNEVDTTEVDTRTVTVGLTGQPGAGSTTDIRANYSRQRARFASALDTFGGATPPSSAVLSPNPLDPAKTFAAFFSPDTSFWSSGHDADNSSRQINVLGSFGLTRGVHQMKFGADYRAIRLEEKPFGVLLEYFVSSIPNLLATGQATLIAGAARESQFLVQSSSFYAQDSWKVKSRLTLTYGLRWELSPPPSAAAGTTLAAWRNVNDPSKLSLAPAGASLWSTTYGGFAPRVGVAYALTPAGDFALRAGWGIYYDLSTESVGALGSAFPNDLNVVFGNVSLPITDASPFVPALSVTPPFRGVVQGFSPGLKLPTSYQWNVALDKSFGAQALSLTYVGQSGRHLFRREGFSRPNANFDGTFQLTDNQARSNYNALQVQYKRPLSKSVQALLNYTYSHSLDNASDDIVAAVSGAVISAENDYASSNFDVRHSFSGAVTFSIPAVSRKGVARAATEDWTLETFLVARSGFSFNGVVGTATIGGANLRPDRLLGQPYWIADSTAPGGRRLNAAAFAIPATVRQGTEGRNDIPGFGLTEVDASVGRKFNFGDRLHLNFRADAFNLLNHPNFTNPPASVGFGPANLISQSMLNHGLHGLNALFQEGGPRSLQLSLKLSF
jgi:hypothetical protein